MGLAQVEKVSWTEHNTNGEVMYKVEEERSLTATVRERQRKWLGLILRRGSLLTWMEESWMEEWREREQEEDLVGC